ncbi:hypothetical protein JKF63_03297 [Porcisia hertigi]|uniref:Uncharacterized protein n=1 Tax=Porcisia hertigi TaxID=2761500 RepID=A0A836III3_9TRYP|nr:hypothetical protein JKF63_03297 [Porcisia hertigi]
MSGLADAVLQCGAAGAAVVSGGLSHYVDAATGACTAAATTASRVPPSSGHTVPNYSPASLVTVVQEQWLHLCEYFQRVQCANTPDERDAMVRELGSVEQALSVILDALLTERKMLVSSCPALQRSDCILGSPFHSERAPPLHTVSDVSQRHTRPSLAASSGDTGAGVCGRAEATTISTHIGASLSASLSSSCFLDGIDAGFAALPPCYRFLFADAHNVSVRPPPRASAETESKATDGSAHPDDPPPIGNIFLLTLCQYAKQDEPPGARFIILGFLSRLIHEVDLPTDRSAYSAGDHAVSLLQLNPSALIVPLLDMVRKVSKALDPRSAVVPRSTSALSSTAAISAAPKWVVECSHDGTLLQDDARKQFVVFLSTLAERMERVPALANFFVVEEGSKKRNLFVLLDALLLYLSHVGTTPEWSHRRDTCRYALSAVVSLAKCSDAWIQDLVAKEERVASRTLSAARTTLVTLCKVPDNDDGATQLLYLRDVLRFWATLLTMAPSVANTLRLLPLIEKEFLYQTLLPLLQSSDSHVYSAACVVTSKLIADLQGAASPLTVCFARVLLSTTIRKASGRIVANKEFYEVMVRDPVTTAATAHKDSCAVTRGQQEEKAAASLHEHPMTSFFTYYILPHLSSNPRLTEEDRESGTALGFATTRWSATKATLLLVQTLAEHVPHIFLREVFLMDITSLSDVRRKQVACVAAADGAERRNPGTPPDLNIHDCFLSQLYLAASANPNLGLQPDRVGEAVLSRLLRVESKLPVAALQTRQHMMSSMKLPCGSAFTATAKSAKATMSPVAAPEAVNCWFHGGVQASPLVRALCEMIHHLDSCPYTVSSLVADLVVSLAVMPDSRVFYTLLDSQRGPLVTALCELRKVLQRHLERKVEEPTPVKKSKSGRRASANAAAAARPLVVSMPFLYDMLLQHWELLVAEDDTEHIKTSDTPDRIPHDCEVSVESLRNAVKEHSNVLHACLYSAYMHAYLDAVVGYTALSQNLMYLRPFD